jgi:hypothetical protein
MRLEFWSPYLPLERGLSQGGFSREIKRKLSIQEQETVGSQDTLASLKMRREDTALLYALKDYFQFNTLVDTIHFLLQLGANAAERQERERSEIFPISPNPVSAGVAMGFVCPICKEKGLGEFSFRTKGEWLDHIEIDNELRTSGQYDALLMMPIHERVKAHEALRKTRTEQKKQKFEAIRGVSK